MHLQTRPTLAFAALLILGATIASSARSAPADDLNALNGEWTYVEDRTPGRSLEQLGPPMGPRFSFRVEEGAVVLVSGHGSGHRDVRIALDGSVTEVKDDEKTARYRGAWKDGAFSYDVDFLRGSSATPSGLIQRTFRATEDGLVVTAIRSTDAIGLYRHEEDIEMPAGAKAAIEDLSWLAGAWVGTKSSGSSVEERWTRPLGGAMLGISRTVSRGRMSGFEYLRVVERDGGLVYVAQPGGNAPTDFVLTELSTTRAVFDNPRNVYPKRITYELSGESDLTATIGFMRGGTPRRFEFQREGE